MVSKQTVRYKSSEVIYRCGSCHMGYKHREDAETCESVPVKKFKFNVGDKVLVENALGMPWLKKDFTGMIVKSYLKDPSDADDYTGMYGEYRGGNYKRPSKWDPTHHNIYDIFINPEYFIKLQTASDLGSPAWKKRSILLHHGLLTFKSEADLSKKMGRYDSKTMGSLKKLNGKIFD
jgi:hypothetical protein